MKPLDSSETHSKHTHEQLPPAQGKQYDARRLAPHRSPRHFYFGKLKMSRERKSFPDRLKRWIMSGGVSVVQTNSIVLTEELQAELSSATPLPKRIGAVGALTEVLTTTKLEKHGIEKVWCLVKDLVDVRKIPPTCRRIALRMLTTYAAGEPEMGNMRMVFINHIKGCFSQEDPETLFNFFRAVLADGRRIENVEGEVGPLLSKWLPLLLKSPAKKDALQLTINLIKFQSSNTDSNVISAYVKEVIRKMHSADDEEEAVLCMTVLETVIAYRYLPVAVLSTALIGLCRLVNVSHLTEQVVKVVKNILRTSEGSTAYDMLMRIINRGADVQLVRSAIFFSAFFTFGTEKISSLRCRKGELLKAMDGSLSEDCPMSREVLILFEVALSLQRLLLNLQPRLSSREWNLVVDLLTHSYANIESLEEGQQKKSIHVVLQDTMNRLEHFVEARQFHGNVDKFYNLMDKVILHQPIASALKVIDHLKVKATPAERNWVRNLYDLVQKYFVDDSRDTVKVKVLSVLNKIYLDHRVQHGSVIVEAIVAKLFVGYERLPSLEVRDLAVSIIDTMVMKESCQSVGNLLKLMEDVFMIKYKQPDALALTTEEAADISTAITSLVIMLRRKSWQLPSRFAVSIYNILITFLENHYKKPRILEKANVIRFKVFLYLMGMDCNERDELGFKIGNLSEIEDRLEGVIEPFTPYVVVSPRERSSQDVQEADGSTGDVSIVCLGEMGRVILLALEIEKDWGVLDHVIRTLTNNLHWKTYVLAFSGDKMDCMALRICRMVYDLSLNYPRCLNITYEVLSRSEFESRLYPLLALLVAYHQQLHAMTQQKVIRTLQLGVINKYAGQLCIEAITLCVMEMPQAMGKQIARIISHFAKITQSVTHSQAMLEFLSTLLHFPRLYSSFIVTQYMCVFAITIPYTNPFKFNHYIVSLAYHVIAMWFLKCHLPFRKQIVKYITNSLMKKLENLNTTFKLKASPRKKGKVTKKDRAKLKEKQEEEEQNQNKIQIFTDLMETCFDLMSRYVFAYCKPVSERQGMLEMLVRGNSQTWIAGNKLITITTSGCSGKLPQAGLCDICRRLCRKGPPDMRKVNMDEVVGDDVADSTKESSPVSEAAPKACPDLIQCDNTQASPSSPSGSFSSVCQAPLNIHNQTCCPTPQPSPSGQPPFSTLPLSPTSIPSRPSPSHSTRALPTQPSPSHATMSPSPSHSTKYKSSQPSPSDQPSPSPSAQLSPSHSLRYPYTQHSPLPQPPTFSAQFSPTGKPPLPPSTLPKSHTSQSSPSHSTLSPSQLSPSFKASPPSPVTQKYIPVQLSPSPSCQSTRHSPSTPHSPPFPFANYPEFSPFLSSPNSSLGLSFTSESSQGVSPQLSPEKPATPPVSPSAQHSHAEMERMPLSRGTLYLPLSQLKKPVATHEVDGGRQSRAVDRRLGTPPRLLPPSLPPLPEELGASGGTAAVLGSLFHACTCWCQNWAELYLRQPCGNFSVMMTIQNSKAFITDSILTLGDLSELPSPFKKDDSTSKGTGGMQDPDLTGERSVGAMRKGGGQQGSEAVPSVEKNQTATKAGMTPKECAQMEAQRNSAVGEDLRGPLSPSFVFLQLYYDGLMPTDESRPILLPTEQAETQRSIRLLDLIKPYDTHKIGVLYVRKGQRREQDILSNTFGSLRYMQFLSALGSHVELAQASEDVFLGGLDTKGVDGKTALIWHDDLLQVVFHVATMMPTRESDPRCNGKKRHIGNNYVTIVYNDSDEPYDTNTIKGQFNHIVIEIVPNYKDTNSVKLHCQPELLNYLRQSNTRLVSNASLPMLVRQMAVHSDLAAKIMESMQRPPHRPYANNWVERLRHIRRINNTVVANIKKSEERFGASQLNDFADLIDVTVRNREPSQPGKYSIQLMY